MWLLFQVGDVLSIGAWCVCVCVGSSFDMFILE